MSGEGGRPASGTLGLRARVTVAFGLGAFALSTVLAVLTYGLVRSSLVDERETSSISQAYLNARLVRDGLRGRNDLGRVLTSLETPSSEGVVVRHEGRWFATSLLVGSDNLPEELRRRVEAGAPARQHFDLNGRSWFAVGVPIPRVEAEFYEAFLLADTDRTLSTLVYSLAGAAALTTLAGAAVGRWVAGRVLRPLRGVSAAAAAIAQGNIDIRLDAVADRDLAPLAESFNRMVDTLAERLRRDARFASDVSHELRSPLTTLSTSVGVLKARRDELSDRGQAALDLIDADLGRFQRMVEDLLEMSRSDAGVADLRMEEVDVHELVTQTLARCASSGLPVPAEVGGRQVAPRPVVVLGDKRRLDRVVANLVENANDYGGGATAVEIETDEKRVRIAVEDNGPGVADAERDLVFERFFRGSASGRRGAGGGTGLGLALVQEHVRLHGGSVWVEKARSGQHGARFVVDIPRLDP